MTNETALRRKPLGFVCAALRQSLTRHLLRIGTAVGCDESSELRFPRDVLQMAAYESQRDQPVMTEPLQALVDKARTIQMTEDQAREQRLSFAYGNTHIENERITREMVEAADLRIQAEKVAAE